MPRWRHLYEHKHLIDTVFDLISLTVWAVGGTAIDLGNFSRLLSLYFHAVCSQLIGQSVHQLRHFNDHADDVFRCPGGFVYNYKAELEIFKQFVITVDNVYLEKNESAVTGETGAQVSM